MYSEFDEAVAEFDAKMIEGKIDDHSFHSAMPIFKNILNKRFYIDRMNSILKSVLERTSQTNLYLITGTFISLHNSKNSNWIVIGHSNKSEFLYMTPIFSFQSPISGPGYIIDKYKLVDDNVFDKFDKKSKIEFSTREFIKPFSIAQKSGHGEIFDIINKNEKEKSFSLRVNSNPIRPFQINFDRSTMETFGITPVDPMSSNLTTIFDLLADISNQSSIEYLLPFVKHELHFVRWRAIRSIFSIDENVGVELVKKACFDRHEHVRAAATSTMSQISA